MKKFVSSAIKIMNWTVKEFVNLNKQLLLKIVKLLPVGYVLNVKLDFIWIKLENVFNFRQTAQKLTQQEHALNVFKDLY